jgi:NAD-dependent DNA ligase
LPDRAGKKTHRDLKGRLRYPMPLTLKEAKKRIQKLREDVVFHEKKYYVENDPQISDYEFDMLIKELINLERQFPELITTPRC